MAQEQGQVSLIFCFSAPRNYIESFFEKREVLLLELLQSGILDVALALRPQNNREHVTFSSRKWATPSTNSRKAVNQLRWISVFSMASRSSFSLSSIWVSSSAVVVIADTLPEWEVARFERVWLNRAMAGSRVGIGITAGTTRTSEDTGDVRPQSRTGRWLVHLRLRYHLDLVVEMSCPSYLLLFPFLLLFIIFQPKRSVSGINTLECIPYVSAIKISISSLLFFASSFRPFFPSAIRSCALVYSANSE